MGARIGAFVWRDRSSFVKSGLLGFGTLFGIWLVWFVGAIGGPGWWLFLVVLAYAAGWVWAQAMWLVVGRAYWEAAEIAKKQRAVEAHDA